MKYKINGDNICMYPENFRDAFRIGVVVTKNNLQNSVDIIDGEIKEIEFDIDDLLSLLEKKNG